MTGDRVRGSKARSAWAVLAGLLAVFVLSLGTDVAMHAIGVFPPWGQAMTDALYLLAIAYRIPCGLAGGFVTARLAPQEPMKHALVMGAVGFGFSVLGAAAAWSKGPEFGPLWYPLALVVSAIPCAWAGAKLHLTRMDVPHAG